jgi:hypothetical protein
VWFHPSGKKVEEEIVPDYEIGKLEELKTIVNERKVINGKI